MAAADFGQGNISADDVFNLMVKDGYQKGTKVRLVICNSAKGTFAQRISNLAEADVIAPNSKMMLDDNTNFIFDGGKWKEITPRKDIDDIY